MPKHLLVGFKIKMTSEGFKVLTRETVWDRREDSVVSTTYKQEQAVPSSPATQSNTAAMANNLI